MFVRHFVVFVDRIRQQRPASPVPSCVSMKSDRSMGLPIMFSDGGGSSNEEEYVLTSAGVHCYASNKDVEVYELTHNKFKVVKFIL